MYKIEKRITLWEINVDQIKAQEFSLSLLKAVENYLTHKEALKMRRDKESKGS